MQTTTIVKPGWITDRRVIRVGFFIAAILEMAVLGILYVNTRNLTDSKDLVTHSYVVIEKLDAILADLSQAGFYQGGYLLAGDQNSLAGLTTIINKINQETVQLRQLTADNRPQQDNVGLLTTQIASRLNSLRQGITLRDQQGGDAALQYMRTDAVRSVSDKIYRQVGVMKDEENSLLQDRNAQSDASTQAATAAFTVGGLLSIGLFSSIFYVLNRKIEDQRRAEETLKRERNLLSTLMDNLLDKVFVKDTESRFIISNRAHQRMLGKTSPDEIVGKSILELFPEDLSTQYYADEQQVVRSGQPLIDREEPAVDASGRRLWHLTTKVPLRNENGKIIGLVGISHDITERKKAEQQMKELERLVAERTEQLRQSEAKFSKAFRASPAAISIATLPDGRWIEINEALEKMTGYSSTEALGHTSAELGLVDDVARTKILEAIRVKGAVRDVEIQIHTKSKEILEVLVSAEQIEINGQACALTIQYDITQRKQQEEEIKRLNSDLKLRADALEAANKELESFSYSVSHDLRAPLRAIDGFSRIVVEEHTAQLSAEAIRYLGLVRNNAQRMGELIDDLLSFSRLGRQAMNKQMIFPAQLAQRVFDDLVVDREGRQVEFVIGDLPPCQADPVLLRQVYVNLLSNALKYTRKRAVAHVEVCCKQVESEQVYSVKDNGAGFDMRYVDKLFGVFQRLQRASEYEGTGVGLAIVQRIISRHGGRVWAEGQPDVGATFYFTLEAKP